MQNSNFDIIRWEGALELLLYKAESFHYMAYKCKVHLLKTILDMKKIMFTCKEFFQTIKRTRNVVIPTEIIHTTLRLQ